MVELSLARDFPPADEAAWKALVEEALKGAPFASLRSKTYDGIAIEPLYPRGARTRPHRGPRRRAPLGRHAADRHRRPGSRQQANPRRSEQRRDGATLVFEGAIGDYGYALPATGAAISAALDDVYLDAGVAIDLDLGLQSKDAAGLIATLVKARGLGPKDCTIRFGFDPLGAHRHERRESAVLGGHRADLRRAASPTSRAKVSPVPSPSPTAGSIHAAGGSEAQELAFALACAVAYLRALERGGIALDDARRFIYFRLAADQDQFLTIAKFRAIRKLWVAHRRGLRA